MRVLGGGVWQVVVLIFLETGENHEREEGGSVDWDRKLLFLTARSWCEESEPGEWCWCVDRDEKIRRCYCLCVCRFTVCVGLCALLRSPYMVLHTVLYISTAVRQLSSNSDDLIVYYQHPLVLLSLRLIHLFHLSLCPSLLIHLSLLLPAASVPLVFLKHFYWWLLTQ